MRIRGWLLEPKHGQAKQGVILGHGYADAPFPDYDLPFDDAVYLFPSFRGLGLSGCTALPSTPDQHVLCGIESRDSYVIGGCVDDLWLSVTTLLELYPALLHRINYMGISFGGGIGALALPWDQRIQRAHLNVPTFGHQPLRLQLPSAGSARSLQEKFRQDHHIVETLRYYDSAVAAGHIGQPVHIAAALFDPLVAPPGQFAIYNALRAKKQLYVLDAGHFEYPRQLQQQRELFEDIAGFFQRDESRILSMAQSQSRS